MTTGVDDFAVYWEHLENTGWTTEMFPPSSDNRPLDDEDGAWQAMAMPLNTGMGRFGGGSTPYAALKAAVEACS